MDNSVSPKGVARSHSRLGAWVSPRQVRPYRTEIESIRPANPVASRSHLGKSNCHAVDASGRRLRHLPWKRLGTRPRRVKIGDRGKSDTGSGKKSVRLCTQSGNRGGDTFEVPLTLSQTFYKYSPIWSGMWRRLMPLEN